MKRSLKSILKLPRLSFIRYNLVFFIAFAVSLSFSILDKDVAIFDDSITDREMIWYVYASVGALTQTLFVAIRDIRIDIKNKCRSKREHSGTPR